MHRFTTLAKKHEGTTTRESRDARNTNAGYPRGYHYKSSLFGFLLSLPERVQRAITFSPPCPLRVVQYTRTESGRLFGKDDPSSGSRVVVFAEVKKQEIVF